MKVGYLIVTPEGLEALAKAGRLLGAKTLTLEVHQIDGEIKVCAKPEAGWIDLCKGWYE